MELPPLEVPLGLYVNTVDGHIMRVVGVVYEAIPLETTTYQRLIRGILEQEIDGLPKGTVVAYHLDEFRAELSTGRGKDKKTVPRFVRYVPEENKSTVIE